MYKYLKGGYKEDSQAPRQWCPVREAETVGTKEAPFEHKEKRFYCEGEHC